MTEGARDPGISASLGGKNRKILRQRVSPKNLECWAIRHLERYGASAAGLRWVLTRRVHKIERSRQERFPEAPDWIDDTVATLLARGYLDDRRYAISRVKHMRARGNSGRRIETSLCEKGISRALAREVLTSTGGDASELQAAICYARRRRLGPFRLDPQARLEKCQRDLAALGRSGFSYEIARRIIVEAADAESLDAKVIPEDIGHCGQGLVLSGPYRNTKPGTR